MDLNDTAGTQLVPRIEESSGSEGDTTTTSDFLRRMSGYTGDDTVSMGTQGTLGALTSHGDNQLTKYIPPSEQLVNHVLPDLETVYLIDYNLSLDFRHDLDNSAKNRYLLKFNKFGNVSKAKLISCMIPENDYLASEPYLYIKVEELGGRCYTSNHDATFGKMILSDNRQGYFHYRPDEESCQQIFAQPPSSQQFTVSFLNYQGRYINLREILISKQVRLKKQNKLKFITRYKHRLTPAEEIEIHIQRKGEIDSYQVNVDTILDDYTFTVDNVFEVLTDQIKVLKNSINCSLCFKLFEINWNLLTKRNMQNAQLIRLSELVSERRKEACKLPQPDTTVITDYVKAQLPSWVRT